MAQPRQSLRRWASDDRNFGNLMGRRLSNRAYSAVVSVTCGIVGGVVFGVLLRVEVSPLMRTLVWPIVVIAVGALFGVALARAERWDRVRRASRLMRDGVGLGPRRQHWRAARVAQALGGGLPQPVGTVWDSARQPATGQTIVMGRGE